MATQALELQLDELPGRPLHGTVATHNPASLRVLVKHGFVGVGTTGDGDTDLHELALS